MKYLVVDLRTIGCLYRYFKLQFHYANQLAKHSLYCALQVGCVTASTHHRIGKGIYHKVCPFHWAEDIKGALPVDSCVLDK